jgi:site-specific DNA-methyltransferase (adenine-specific)
MGPHDEPTSIAKIPGGRLQQFFTPSWAAQRLVETCYPELGRNHVVIEPTCGKGAFIKAIPDNVQAYGIEIDPVLAETARYNTGRTIITGDFRLVDLPERPTHIIGNPPFRKALVDELLQWAKEVLPQEGKAGLILPAYHMQFSSSVRRWQQDWSIRNNMIPKHLFPGLKYPLCFIMFEKTVHKTFHGFLLYEEADSIRNLSKPAKLILQNGKPRTSLWKALVDEALDYYGGSADLPKIYEWCGDRRPSDNPWWKQQIRKVCQDHFTRTERATYARAAA